MSFLFIKNIFKIIGYKNRKHYLKSLAEEYDLKLSSVLLIADTLGEQEDFDGLIISLDDYSQMMEFGD